MCDIQKEICKSDCLNWGKCISEIYSCNNNICEVPQDCKLTPETCVENCKEDAECMVCNSCDFIQDGECDDGGVGSDFNICERNTDCEDCKQLEAPSSPPPNPQCVDIPYLCKSCIESGVTCLQEMYCVLNNDPLFCETHKPQGSCNDVSSFCLTECSKYSKCFTCENSCDFFDDEECDDGGSGSEYTECPSGSDCVDCGPRGGSYSQKPPELPPLIPPPLPSILSPQSSPLFPQPSPLSPQPSSSSAQPSPLSPQFPHSFEPPSSLPMNSPVLPSPMKSPSISPIPTSPLSSRSDSLIKNTYPNPVIGMSIIIPVLALTVIGTFFHKYRRRRSLTMEAPLTRSNVYVEHNNL